MTHPEWTELEAKFVEEGRQDVAGVVLHDTAGSGQHADTLYLANPGDGRRVSVDFTVERDGSIWKLNPDLRALYCLHAGRATRFKGLRNGEVNRGTIGIEICQRGDLSLRPLYPESQVRAVARLSAWLTKEFTLTTSDITTHRQIITDGSRSDPRRFPFDGPGGFWELYWREKGRGEAYAAADAMWKLPSGKAGQRTHTVKPGETLGAIARRHYGRASRWPLIQKENRLTGTVIVPGQVLIIPPPSPASPSP